jgi:hypothetical protein
MVFVLLSRMATHIVSYRMLKNAASGVLGSSKSSTYPRGYASGFDLPAAWLDSLFEHPLFERL